MKHLAALTTFIFILFGSNAQEIPALHFNDYLLLNPAYAGFNGKNRIGFLCRTYINELDIGNQASGLDYYASYSGQSKKIKSGLGTYFNFISHDSERTNAYKGNFSYSYHISIKDKHKLVPALSMTYIKKDRIVL